MLFRSAERERIPCGAPAAGRRWALSRTGIAAKRSSWLAGPLSRIRARYRRLTALARMVLAGGVSGALELDRPDVSERGGGDDLLDGAVYGVVDEAGYDQGFWRTWGPTEPSDVVSHALGRVGYRHGLGDLV